MYTLDKLQKAKRELSESEDWASLLGAPYYGGVNHDSIGYGYLYKVTLSKVTVYHQLNTGDKNYHTAPGHLIKHLNAAIMANFTTILADALAAQQAELKQIAAEAAAEYKSIADTAGIELGETQ